MVTVQFREDIFTWITAIFTLIEAKSKIMAAAAVVTIFILIIC